MSYDPNEYPALYYRGWPEEGDNGFCEAREADILAHPCVVEAMAKAREEGSASERIWTERARARHREAESDLAVSREALTSTIRDRNELRKVVHAYDVVINALPIPIKVAFCMTTPTAYRGGSREDVEAEFARRLATERV